MAKTNQKSKKDAKNRRRAAYLDRVKALFVVKIVYPFYQKGVFFIVIYVLCL